MNILTEKLPDTILVSGIKYNVNTDFRIWIQIEELLLGLTNANLIKVLALCYKNELPSDYSSAVSAAIDFITCYKKNTKKGGNSSKTVKNVYHYEYDSFLIYSAFMEKYNIDLSTVSMHWFLFKALFEGLENCRFTKIMEFRSVNLADIKDKEQKKYYRRMKNLYKLPDLRTEEQKETDMIETLNTMF